jgi:hypothetical protein
MARLLSERETILPQIGRARRFLGSVSRKGGDDAQRCQVVPRVKKPNHLLMRAWSFAVFAKLSAKLMFRNRASLVKTLRTEVRFGVLSQKPRARA